MGNLLSSSFVSLEGNDSKSQGFYFRNMAAPKHDWFFRQWLRTLQLKQADVVARTDWPKSKVSKLVNGTVAYNRDIINEAAAALHVRPYELLLHPDDAMALRKYRESAITLASDRSSLAEGADEDPLFELGKAKNAR